jgi:hypothetical protein
MEFNNQILGGKKSKSRKSKSPIFDFIEKNLDTVQDYLK